jgi:hypothetical protein
MFSHTTSLYDISRQPSTHISSSPSSCHLFFEQDIRRVARAMNTNKGEDEEGIQDEFLKKGVSYLESYISYLFNEVACSGVPPSWT